MFYRIHIVIKKNSSRPVAIYFIVSLMNLDGEMTYIYTHKGIYVDTLAHARTNGPYRLSARVRIIYIAQ